MAPRSSIGQESDVSKKESTEEKGEVKVKGTLAQIVKKLVKTGKEKGFVTYDELNKAIPTLVSDELLKNFLNIFCIFSSYFSSVNLF